MPSKKKPAARPRLRPATENRSKPDPILNLRAVSLWRDNPILKKIDWRIEPGEHWALLGPNGSGKTSLLSAITAYFTASSGTIELLGKRYGESDWRELRKRIGLVTSAVAQMIQDGETALHVVMSGHEAMINYWGLAPAALEKRALSTLSRLGCRRLAARTWAQLSQGERQRALIGRALMADLSLLILDEPCAGLDLVARESFLEFLQSLAKRPDAPAMILVTHHVEEIIPAISHVLLLGGGRVMAAGPKSKVLNSANLSRAFGARVKLNTRQGRYAAQVAPDSKRWRRFVIRKGKR